MIEIQSPGWHLVYFGFIVLVNYSTTVVLQINGMYRHTETLPNFEIFNIQNIPLLTPIGDIINWFDHQVAPPSLVAVLATRWRRLSCPVGFTRW